MWYFPPPPSPNEKIEEERRRARLEKSVGDFEGWGISPYKDDATAQRVREMLGFLEPEPKEKK